VVSSLISGFITQKIGYYVPAMILCPCIMSIGEGLMSTFNPDTDSAHWVAFQFLAGFGLGFGMQTAGLAMQTVLPRDDVPIGIAIMFFTQQLGGAVFTSVGQSILSNLLVAQLTGVPGLDPQGIVMQGATNLFEAVPIEFVPLVIEAYNYACTRIFLAGMGLAFGALLSAFGMEWRSIKKGKNGQGGPAGPGGAAGPGAPGPKPAGPEMEKPASDQQASQEAVAQKV
jgi:MFS family permease